MLCIISPYAAVYAHGAHRVGRHGARGKHLRHSCDLWAWWCCLRCYCWLGCQWRDGRRPLAPLQQRLLRRGKIRISCPEPADTWPHIWIYTTSVWAAQAKPRSSQLATVWLLAVVSHSWCTSSQQGRLITIVTRREKSSIHEIQTDHASLFHRGGSVWKKEACDKWRVGSPSFGEDGCWSPLCSTCGLLCRLNETAARARARHACCSPADLARPRVAGASSSSQRSTGGAVCPLLALAPPAVPRESSTVRSRNQP